MSNGMKTSGEWEGNDKIASLLERIDSIAKEQGRINAEANTILRELLDLRIKTSQHKILGKGLVNKLDAIEDKEASLLAHKHMIR